MALTWVLLVALSLAGVVVSRPDFTGGAGHHHGHHHHHHDQHHPEHHHDDHHQQHHHDHTTSEVSSEYAYPLPEPSSDASANAEMLPHESPKEPSGYAYPPPAYSFDPSGYGALNPPEPSDEQSDYAYPVPHHSLDASASADLHVPDTFEARDQSSLESSAEVSGYAYPVPEHSFDASGSGSLSPPQESDELLGYAYPVPAHSFDASAGADLSPPEESDDQLGYAYPVPAHSFDASAGADLSPPEESDDQLGYAYPVPAHSFDASGGADLSPPEVPDAPIGYYLPVTAHSSEESEEYEHTAPPVRHPYGYSYPVPARAFDFEVNGHHSGSSSRKGSSLSREHQSTGTSHDSRQRAPGTSSAISTSSTNNNGVPALTQSVKEQLRETVQTVHGIDFTAFEEVGKAHTSIPELRGVGAGHQVIQAPSSKVQLFPRLHSSTNSKPGSVFFNPNLPAIQHKETHGGSSTTDNASVKSATLSAFRGSRGHGESKAQEKEEEAEAEERQVKSSSTSLLDKDFNPLSHFQIRTHSFQPSTATRRLAQRFNKHPKETRVEDRENKAKAEEEDNAKAEVEEDEEAQVSNVRHFSSTPSLSRKYGPARSGDSEVSTLSLFVKQEEEHEEEEEGEGAEEDEEEEDEDSDEDDEYEVRHPLFIILGSHKNGNSNRRAYGYPSHGAQDEGSEYGRTLFLPYISGDEDSEDPLDNLRLPLSVVPGLGKFDDLQLTKLNDQLTGYVTDLDHSKTAEFIHLLTQHVEEDDDSSSSEESDEESDEEEEEEEEEEEGGGEEEDKEENGGEDGGHNGNEEGNKAISYQYGTPRSHRTENIPNHFRVSTSNSPSNIPLAPGTHPRETRRQDAFEVSSQTTSGNYQQPKIEEQSQQAVTATSRRQPFSRTFRRSQLGQIVINEAPQAEKSGSQRVERIRTSSRGFDSENIGKIAITEVPNKLYSIKGHPGSSDTISHLSVGQPVTVL